MTGMFCSNCGAQRAPGAAFCASCGTALGAAPAAPPAAPPVTPVAPAAEPSAAGPQYAPPPVPHQVPVQPQPVQPQMQQPVQPQVQQAWAQSAPYPGTAAQPAPAPWGAATTAAPLATAPKRNYVDALLTGDWGGAAKTAGIAVGVMTAISLVGMLLVTEGGIGFRETMVLVLGGVCLAVGGDAFTEADADAFSTAGSFTVGVLPLTITLVGLGLLGVLYAKQLRNRPPATATDGLLHGVRTVLVFAAMFLPLSLLTRYTNDEANPFGLVGRVGVGVMSTLFGAFLFAVAALGLAWFFSRATVFPARVAAFRDKARAPLAGAVAVFAVGLLAVLVAVIYVLVEEGEPLVTFGAVVLAAGNGALLSVLLSAGVPLNAEGNAAGNSMLGGFSPSGSQSVDLFNFTDDSAWYWLAPIVLLAALVLVATALAVRQNTIEDARREGARFAGALALVAFVATLLLRIGMDGEGSAGDFGAASADGSIMFNPLMAALVLGVWGVVTGLLAPVVAAKMPSGFVVGVRNRFGAAAEPTTPPAAAPPAG